MPPYIQNIVFDNSPRGSDMYYADEDDVIGFEVRKKSIAGNFWECLTGKRSKPTEVILFDDGPRRRQDLFSYEGRCYDDDLGWMPRRCRPRSGQSYRYREMIEEYNCTGCIYCLYEPNLGRWHRPGPRPGRGRWRYDGYGKSEVDWDPAPFWDLDWIPPPYHGSRRRSNWSSKYDNAEHMMRHELIKLMQQRLREERHERIYASYPAGYSLDRWRRRNDRVDELDRKIHEMRGRWDAFYRDEEYVPDLDYDSDD